MFGSILGLSLRGARIAYVYIRLTYMIHDIRTEGYLDGKMVLNYSS